MEQNIRQHMTDLGCKSSQEISLAFRVYLELLDVKLMHDINIHYNENIQKLYLTAKITKNSTSHFIVPVLASGSVEMEFIEKLQANLCDDNSKKSITLACVEGDSTVVFYSFGNHLIDPLNPETFVRQKSREMRKHHIENEIRKNRNLLLFEACNQNDEDEPSD